MILLSAPVTGGPNPSRGGGRFGDGGDLSRGLVAAPGPGGRDPIKGGGGAGNDLVALN